MSPYYAYEDFPGPQAQTHDELLAAASQRAQTTFHPGCTCRMGPASDPSAVVDDQLKVHGLEGLRVVDASIMPRMISANLNASTMMIADKASDLITGSRRRRQRSCRICGRSARLVMSKITGASILIQTYGRGLVGVLGYHCCNQVSAARMCQKPTSNVHAKGNVR